MVRGKKDIIKILNKPMFFYFIIQRLIKLKSRKSVTKLIYKITLIPSDNFIGLSSRIANITIEILCHP